MKVPQIMRNPSWLHGFVAGSLSTEIMYMWMSYRTSKINDRQLWEPAFTDNSEPTSAGTDAAGTGIGETQNSG